MPRDFACCRVSTADQTTENQIQEITAAGCGILTQRIITETVSGSVAAMERKGSARLVDRLEPRDVLVVKKMDRLGRDAIDVRATAVRLQAAGIRVRCLALGGVDLTSAAGKMTMSIINVVAEFEGDLLIERTRSGLIRAMAEGKVFGRPSALSSEQQVQVGNRLAEGAPVAQLAREFRTGRQTVMRIRDASA